MMDSRQRADLDRYITGNYGEDAVAAEPKRRRHKRWPNDVGVSEICERACDAVRFRINGQWTIWFHATYQEGVEDCKPAPWCEG